MTWRGAGSGPRFVARIRMRTSSGAALAYSTTTSKKGSPSKTPVSSSSTCGRPTSTRRPPFRMTSSSRRTPVVAAATRSMVGERGHRVEVEVELLDVLAVVPLRIREAEEPLLEDRVLLVPQAEGEAQALLVVGDAEQAVLVPPVGPPTSVVVGERAPGVSAGRIVLAHGTPGSLGQIRSPAPPGHAAPSLLEPPALGSRDLGRHGAPPTARHRAMSLRSHRIQTSNPSATGWASIGSGARRVMG